MKLSKKRILPLLKSLALKHQRVFLRADLNVPIKNKKILDDYRLQAIIPTIKYIMEQSAKVILASHMGRPPAHTVHATLDDQFSTRILGSWLKKEGFEVEFESDLLRAEQKSKGNFSKILLLENMRFYKEEIQTNDTFAALLAKLADVYVNDAFGAIHRNHTSISLLPNHFQKGARAIGFIVEHEVKMLNKLYKKPRQPFLMILGGNKIKEKLAVLTHFLSSSSAITPHIICLGGPLAYTIMAAQQKSIGNSLYEPSMLEAAKQFLASIEKTKTILKLPLDHLIVDELGEKPKVCTGAQIPEGKKAIDIGPLTVQLFCNQILEAKTIFANGPLGMYEYPEYAKGTSILLRALGFASACTIIGGGDLTAVAHAEKLDGKFDLLSTGGGATLEFLSSKNPEQQLPGLAALLETE